MLLNEIYFTSLNVISKLSEDLVTAESELDALLLNFVKTQITDKVQFSIKPITEEIIEADVRKIPSNKRDLDGISIRGTQRLFSVKYLFGEAIIA